MQDLHREIALGVRRSGVRCSIRLQAPRWVTQYLDDIQQSSSENELQMSNSTHNGDVRILGNEQLYRFACLLAISSIACRRYN